MLLKERLDNIFKDFGLNFNSTGNNVLKRLAKDEEETDYGNFFLKINDQSVAKNVDFLGEIGLLYDLLIYLLGNGMRVVNSAQTQIDFFKAIHDTCTANDYLKPENWHYRSKWRTKKENFCRIRKYFK